MVYNPRNGIRAKQVFISFTDAARKTGVSTVGMTGTNFTSNAFANFWGAYYGDLTLNSVDYFPVDLGFDSTGCSVNFQTAAYDTISAISGTSMTLTSNTSMTVDEHINRYVIVKAAAGTPSLVYARVTDNAAATITTDTALDTNYGVAAADTIALLEVPVGLVMNAWQRVDHIATDFSLEPPSTETEQTYFMGTEDSAGSQNSVVDTNPPSFMTGSVTIRGGVKDLLRLKYAEDSSAPTNYIRYNIGSESTNNIGVVVVWATNVGDVDHTDAVYQAVFCNDITVKNVGILNSVNADGRAEATIEFEVKGANVRVEMVEAQADNTANNA